MPIKVLLADDHKVIRDGLAAILGNHPDIQVVASAADGIQALEAARKLRPDIAVLDINMPTLNGIEAGRQIRETCPEIEIIILSMYATNEHVYQAMKAGAKGYLLKETSGLEVVEAIRVVGRGERYLSQQITETLINGYLEQRLLGEESPSPLRELSDRERQVLQLVVESKTSADIAQILHLSVSTVNTYRSRLMKKLGVGDVPELVKFAIDNRLI
jgi:DNA-binding NarL/FixJ family response regulator